MRNYGDETLVVRDKYKVGLSDGPVVRDKYKVGLSDGPCAI
jgi:hypothetical protein